MSGRHKWSELRRRLTPEQRKYIEKKKAEAIAVMDREIHIEPIVLDWSAWYSWLDIERDARYDGVVVPNKEPGIYEVRLHKQKERLVIGRSNDLRMRIKQGLVRGKVPHSTGERIRAGIKKGEISASDISIRWAVTDRPSAVQEELHRRYRGQFGELPKYSKRG